MIELNTEIASVLSQMRKSASFMAIHNYQDNNNGIATYGIVFNINYLKAVHRSLKIMQDYIPQTPLEEQARDDLIQSFNDTIMGNNPRAKSAHAYDKISHDENLVNGIKYHTKQGIIHLYGFIVHKKVIQEPTYPKSNRSSWAITRNYLRSKTPVSKFRQFKLEPGRLSHISVENLTLTDKAFLSGMES